jgi:hypothetical protein
MYMRNWYSSTCNNVTLFFFGFRSKSRINPWVTVFRFIPVVTTVLRSDELSHYDKRFGQQRRKFADLFRLSEVCKEVFTVCKEVLSVCTDVCGKFLLITRMVLLCRVWYSQELNTFLFLSTVYWTFSLDKISQSWKVRLEKFCGIYCRVPTGVDSNYHHDNYVSFITWQLCLSCWLSDLLIRVHSILV